MKEKGSLNTGYASTITLLCIALFTAFLAGCATGSLGVRNMSAVSRYFDKDVNAVWDAVIQTAEGIPIEVQDKGKGSIKTQWIRGWSTTRTTGVLLEGQWQERHRLYITVKGEQNKTYVSINAQIEEKPPGGSQAYRWDRVASDGTLEQAFLKKLEYILNNP